MLKNTKVTCGILNFADTLNDLLTNNKNLATTLKLVDEAILRLAQNASANQFVDINGIEINIFLTSKTSLSAKDLNSGNNNSTISLESLEIPNIGNNNNLNLAVVIAKLPIVNQSLEQDENKTSYEATKTLLQIPGSDYLSISVFNRNNFKEIPVAVSFLTAVASPSPVVQQFLNPDNIFNERRVVTDLQYSCQYFDQVSRRFSSYGCITNRSHGNMSKIICSCNHTTIFAVLLAVNNFAIPTGVRVISNIYLTHF